jgi:hypothetical protein
MGKQPWMIKGAAWIGMIVVALMLAACGGQPEQQRLAGQQEQPATEKTAETPTEKPTKPTKEPEPAKPTEREAAQAVLDALQKDDLAKAAEWVQPEKGVRYSPYAFVDVENDVVVEKEALSGLMSDAAMKVWGTHAGSGEPIEMTYADYHKQYVIDADFGKDAEVAVNERLGEGTTTSNLNDVYPSANHVFVEYHIDGIDPKLEGMDWRSLRLVFAKAESGQLFLVGIVHDQWTP